MQTLILAKYLYSRALEIYSPADEMTYGLSVSLMQDSAEMLVWHMAKHFNIKSKPKDGFVNLIEIIEENKHCIIDCKQKMYELNQARVNFKHYGNSPSKLDMPKYIETCTQFLSMNSLHIGVNFDSISAADSVQHIKIRNHLKSSEIEIKNGNMKEALIQSSIAFQELEKIAYSKMSDSLDRIQTIKNSYSKIPNDYIETARDVTEAISEVLESTIKTIALSSIGYKPEHFLSIKSMCYIVNISQSGNRIGVYSYRTLKEDEDSIKFINNFIIDAARKI